MSTKNLLIATLGGSPAPLEKQITEIRAERVLFICSEESRAQVQHVIAKVNERGFTFGEGNYDVFVVRNHEDVESTVEVVIGQVQTEAQRWKKRGSEYRIVVDFTGGTKTMSVGLAFATQYWECNWAYVGGDERDPEDRMVVLAGREAIRQVVNPNVSMGLRRLDLGARLFDGGQFSAAVEVIKVDRETHLDLRTKDVMNALSALAKAYAAWDGFDHRGAARELQSFLKQVNRLETLAGRERVDAWQQMADQEQKRAALLADQTQDHAGQKKVKVTLDLLQDIFANAVRCERQERYDDAVARLYRCTEGLAQLALQKYDIDTSQVAVDAIPELLRNRWGLSAGSDPIEVGLHQGFELLESLGDELGSPFMNSALGPTKNALAARNRSILAHGLRKVTKDEMEKIKSGLLNLEPKLNAVAFAEYQLSAHLGVR